MISDSLVELAQPLVEAQKTHPFVEGIGKGQLSPERLRRWLGQDLLYLESYTRSLAFAVAKAPDLDAMLKWNAMLNHTLKVEIKEIAQLAHEFGIPLDKQADRELLPAARAYSDFLLGVASGGTFSEIITCHLPCAWDYHQVALHLKGKGLPADNRYARWITQYADLQFQELVLWLKGELDRLVGHAQGPQQERLKDLFLTATRYELKFWDMCWYGEDWPG